MGERGGGNEKRQQMWRDGKTVERTTECEVVLALATKDGVHGVVREVQDLFTTKP